MPFDSVLLCVCFMLITKLSKNAEQLQALHGAGNKAKRLRGQWMQLTHGSGTIASTEQSEAVYMVIQQVFTRTDSSKFFLRDDARAVPSPHLLLIADTAETSEPRVPPHGRVGVNAIKQMVQKIAVAEAEAMVTQTSIRRGYAGRHPSVWRRLMAPWNNADLRRQQEYSAPQSTEGIGRHRQLAELQRCHLHAFVLGLPCPSGHADPHGLPCPSGHADPPCCTLWVPVPHKVRKASEGIGNSQNFNGVIYTH
eukprot:TRINITY_DN10090_c0_g1_i7.p1 TRINITY_DN10090_c0_g1~~TRINITY_DN10090_c0_g1_i7.p1  ORF type:complete len:252 (-),score=9.15 TRINITY_DN10090_c0_g1_i7:1305-2060(-)